MANAKKNIAKTAASKKIAAQVETVKASRVEDPALNKTQTKIFESDKPKSEKFRLLFKNGLSKSHIARLFGSPYSFVRAAIERQEGLEAEVAAKYASKEKEVA